jgi:hypothetical protein
MTFMPNSPEARDIASYIHPQTNPRAHQTSPRPASYAIAFPMQEDRMAGRAAPNR